MLAEMQLYYPWRNEYEDLHCDNAKLCEEKFNEDQSSKYRAIVARCNYLSPGRPDIAFSVKELCRRMSAPSQADYLALKRLGRYLQGAPRLVHRLMGRTTLARSQ